MKAKILVLVVLMGMSSVLIAQPAERGSKKPFRGQNPEMRMNERQRVPGEGLNLTAEQKDAFKKSMLEVQKQLQPIRNELGEAMARQKTLTTAEKPDMGAINKNIEKMGALKTEMAKIQAKHRLEMRAQLTDEQRLKFDMFKGQLMQKRGHNRFGNMGRN